MRSTSVKPSAYPALPFHIIRAVGFLSSVVVGIILAVFIYHLHADGYKLPFAFLICLVTALFTILNVTFTGVINCSCGLSPKLSIILNMLLLILWLLSLALLSYSMSSTILTKCGTEYWGNSTGISVCRSYKALFVFTILGTASYIASIALDFTVRRRQNRLGEYNPMGSHLMPGEDPFDVKLADRNSETLSYDHVPPPMTGAQHATPYAHSFERGHADESEMFYDTAPARSGQAGPRVRFSAYDQGGYRHPAEQTGYDPAAYR
ncbi:hypothetical protein N7532_008690 [Penicillium argentinense]|uniref:MARVEL domain-containing protein n=1 Tax=Penicillium argentinense TaxID=1131581 RepID=A0A9W9EY29_9EURO|nr:uncharacterized protein N7532_008690 [Penicillium argentinense]KAJ5090006.1 hypothetical protein N7532_008690 [Penicillium argentinense]